MHVDASLLKLRHYQTPPRAFTGRSRIAAVKSLQEHSLHVWLPYFALVAITIHNCVRGGLAGPEWGSPHAVRDRQNAGSKRP